VMVRHGAGQQYVDLAALCRFGEAVDEGVVRRGVGAQQEIPDRG